MTKIRLALIAGGKSDEREVSLAGAIGVEKELDAAKYDVTRYDPATDLAVIAQNSENIDAAFILLHGLYGEDGTIQGFLDLLDIPYQGAGVLGSAMAMNKNLAKERYKEYGLTVAPWVMAEVGDIQNPERIASLLTLPYVVKPVKQGSSIGMSVVKEVDALSGALELAFKHDDEVMVEEYIKGREITVGVIGNKELLSLPLVEIIPDSRFEFFDYEAKYEVGATTEVCPAQIDQSIAARAQEYSQIAHKCLELRGYSRTDMIVRDDEIFVLETNTIPGMTPTSLLPQAAAAAGFPFPKLLDKLIELALENR